jgi:carboxynorspermidine decarboxylase
MSADRIQIKFSKLIFQDMAHYTMVKNNTFNDVHMPSIAISDASGDVRIV